MCVCVRDLTYKELKTYMGSVLSVYIYIYRLSTLYVQSMQYDNYISYVYTNLYYILCIYEICSHVKFYVDMTS